MKKNNIEKTLFIGQGELAHWFRYKIETSNTDDTLYTEKKGKKDDVLKAITQAGINYCLDELFKIINDRKIVIGRYKYPTDDEALNEMLIDGYIVPIIKTSMSLRFYDTNTINNVFEKIYEEKDK